MSLLAPAVYFLLNPVHRVLHGLYGGFDGCTVNIALRNRLFHHLNLVLDVLKLAHPEGDILAPTVNCMPSLLTVRQPVVDDLADEGDDSTA